jgi:hypothetical protein
MRYRFYKIKRKIYKFGHQMKSGGTHMSYSHPVFFFDESEQSTREETGRLGQRLNGDDGEWP